MKWFNFYELFLKIYNSMPNKFKSSAYNIMQKLYGDGWYGLFCLRSLYHTIKYMSDKEFDDRVNEGFKD